MGAHLVDQQLRVIPRLVVRQLQEGATPVNKGLQGAARVLAACIEHHEKQQVHTHLHILRVLLVLLFGTADLCLKERLALAVVGEHDAASGCAERVWVCSDRGECATPKGIKHRQ